MARNMLNGDEIDMNRLRTIITLGFGGVIWGGLLGIPTGAILGCSFGLYKGDISLGLDGAMIGACLLAAVGAVYGCILGVREPHPQSMAAPGSSEKDLSLAENFHQWENSL